MPEDTAYPCPDPYGVHKAFTAMQIMKEALTEIAAPPDGDHDALDILQEHWAIAAMALAGSRE